MAVGETVSKGTRKEKCLGDCEDGWLTGCSSEDEMAKE